MPKKQIKVIKEANSNFLKVGEDYYCVGGEDKKGNMVFNKVEPRKYEILTKKIIPKLKNVVKVERILAGALSKLSFEELEGIYNRLYTAKKKARPKSKDGCLYIQVGKYRVDLQD